MIKKLSIKWVMIFGMPVLVLGIISIIIITSYFTSKRVFTDHAHEIMKNISSYTIDKSRSHLNPARDAALLTNALAVNKIVTSSNNSEMESYFYELLLINSQFSNIYYGTVEGEFIMVSRDGDKNFDVKNISFPEGIRNVQFRKMDLYFNELSRFNDSFDSFDPRKRPWFKSALDAKTLIWTDPYVFFTSKNPGITTASPVFNSNGTLHGVVGVDIEISELSDFFSTLSIGKKGKAFILNGKGDVLAYPDKSKITHRQGESENFSLVKISELDDELSQQAYNTLLEFNYELNEKSEIFFAFQHNDVTYHAMFAPFKVSYWPWLLGIYIPENDYIGSLKRNRTNIVLLSLSLGLITIFVGFSITRSIVNPLKRLQNAARDLGSGNLKKPILTESYYRELDDTARDFDLMRKSLKEKGKLEIQLLQNQKVESIGRLAGGVAHDLNNLLTPILGYSEMMLNMKEIDPHLIRLINQINHAGLKAKELVHQLLAFSRKQDLEYKNLNLNHTVEDFKILLKRTIREDIQIDILLSQEKPMVWGDQGQLEQVILNLSVNAQDAMPLGGLLKIKTSVVDLHKTLSNNLNDLKPGKYVLFAISDTGTGIESNILDKIFEPFFSTKGQHGVGLGLATVFGIINQHKGHILVSTKINQGTSFDIYLPFVNQPEDEIRHKNPRRQFKKGTETILIAEDNQQVLDLTSTILKSQGYNIILAKNGSQALDVLAHCGDSIHLLLSDVVMPEINGKDLYEKAQEMHEDIKVLFMSGYEDQAISRHNVLDKGTKFLQKPFSNSTLIERVREVLDC